MRFPAVSQAVSFGDPMSVNSNCPSTRKSLPPLNNVRVLDLSRLLPGPYCSMILADHGARVIAIEDKRYQQDDFFIYPVYRNKEHMTLNLKTDDGQKIFLQLLDKADRRFPPEALATISRLFARMAAGKVVEEGLDLVVGCDVVPADEPGWDTVPFKMAACSSEKFTFLRSLPLSTSTCCVSRDRLSRDAIT